MKAPPEFGIIPQAFWDDPYPTLAAMRRDAPICFVPQLNAILLNKRDDIFTCEKNVAVFSSQQAGGLMTVLMGENMMRKDGDAHMKERREIFPAISPKTVKNTWRTHFERETRTVIDGLKDRSGFDIVRDFAMPVSGHALRHITGLTQLRPDEIDQTSQAMIDGVGNYGGDPALEAACHAATAKLDAAIDARIAANAPDDDTSIVAVLHRAGQPIESIRANVKLAISGGQNEPRDAIAGAAWALLTHPEERAKVAKDEATWLQVFEEYARWISPIGMSPREIKQDFEWGGVTLVKGTRAFLMFSSANRDEDHFDEPDAFRVNRDTSKAISFGAGPHFCA
ncbi:cytochrome P450 [Pseudahrensia aquimaris]|uniref:Cytochrome P450 n=1 Tax=Pseudahrensia aquimaris TaxID=744461 RepID=A0ABW3FJN6_9HYPH